MAMYGADSGGEVRVRVLRPASSGSASSRPDTNWEETSPAIEKSPADRRPWQYRSSPCAQIVMPRRHSASERGAMGRCGRRPCRLNTARTPSAPATGSRKRSVAPLSPQGRTQSPSFGAERGVTI